ncbi:Ankyrin repeat-containing domain protein [Metarhizium brunneum]
MSTPDDADSVTTRLVASQNGSVAEKEGKWTAALHALGDEERQLFKNLDVEKLALGILQDVLAETLKKKEDCLRKRGKVRIQGREIVIRDVLDKLSACITKFISIGDIIVQYDPVHAALPWAAARFVLQVAVDDPETFDLVLFYIERLVYYITISSIFDVQYLQPKHHLLDVYPQLFEAIETLQTNVLKFLGYLLRHFGSSTIARHLKSIVVSKKDIEAKFQPIEKAWRRVDELSRLATAEKNEEEFEVLQNKLQELYRPIARSADHLEAIQDGLEREARVRILKAISTIPYPVHHKTARKGRLERPDQPILGLVVEQYREAIDGFSEFEDQAWSIEESQRVVLELLAEYPAVAIILDALDEIRSLEPLKVAADIRNRLGKLPPTLEGSYWEIYNTILESGRHASKLSIFTFQWLLYGQKVITADNFVAIASASLQIEEPDGETGRSDSLEAITTGEILDVCANLVVLRNGVFVLAHLSVREFLEGLTARSVDTMIAARGNAAIAAACLQLLLTRTEAARTGFEEGYGNDSIDDSSMPGAENHQPKATVKAQPPEPEPIHVKIATKMINGDDPHALTYSCVYWVQHVQASKELRTKHPLTVLLTEFLINAKDCKKVTISFQAWHALATVSKDPEDFPVENKFHDAVRDKPSPIWVACLYKWYELVQQVSQSNRYDGINQERSIQSIEAPEEWDITRGDMTPLIYAAVARDVKLTTLVLDNIGMEI